MSLYETLYPYQKNIVDKFKDKERYGLFLDMGLGKTLVSLAFSEVNKCTKVIVITINSKATEPITLKGSWLWWANKSDIKYNFYDKKIFNPPKKKPNNYSISTNDFLILNYEGLYSRSSKTFALRKEINDFINTCKGHNVAIIVDESHKVKDQESSQSKAVNLIYKWCKVKAKKTYLYLGTGTPFTKDYLDLYAQLKLLGWDQNKETFKDLFCIRGHLPGRLGWQQPIVGFKNLDTLYKLVHCFAITIKSEDVLDLPDKIFVDHESQQSWEFAVLCSEKLPGKIIKEECERRGLPLTLLRQTDDYGKPIDYTKKTRVNNPFYRNMAFPEEKWTANEKGVMWMRARQMSIGFQGNEEDYLWYNKSRLEELKRFLTEHEDNYLIFVNYAPELIAVFNICYDLGYNIDVCSGKIKSLIFYDEYSKQSEEEKLTNKKNVIIANTVSGSVGMNWQEYNKCILFSIPLFSQYEQGLKRIHRNGQKETCIYHTFYQDNWLDHGMLKALRSAQEYNNNMFEADLQRINELMDEEDE